MSLLFVFPEGTGQHLVKAGAQHGCWAK